MVLLSTGHYRSCLRLELHFPVCFRNGSRTVETADERNPCKFWEGEAKGKPWLLKRHGGQPWWQCYQAVWTDAVALQISPWAPTPRPHFGTLMHAASQAFPQAHLSHPCHVHHLGFGWKWLATAFWTLQLFPLEPGSHGYSQICLSPNSYVKPSIPLILVKALCSWLKPLVVQGNIPKKGLWNSLTSLGMLMTPLLHHGHPCHKVAKHLN